MVEVFYAEIETPSFPPGSEPVLDLGAIFISADHQLLPAATGHDILGDIKDLFFSLQEKEITGLQKRIRVDADKIVAAGSLDQAQVIYWHTSLGSIANLGPKQFLAVLAWEIPAYFVPKTKPFFMGHPLQDPAAFLDLIYPFQGGKPGLISDSPIGFNLNPPNHEHPGAPSNRRLMATGIYLQLGAWLDYYTGSYDPSFSKTLLRVAESEVEFGKLEEQIPAEHRPLFPQLNVDNSFPPTLMIHGSEDTAVLVDESRNLKRSLDRVGVPVEIIEVEGQEHGFDIVPGSAEKYKQEFDQIKSFLCEILGS